MIRTVIVDDETHILDELKQYLSKIEDVNLLGAYTNPLDALHFVMGNDVDMAILDIEMQKINGIEFADSLKKMNNSIQVIFVTGYDQYAMEAFRTNAIAYLLKPYTFNELCSAIEKVRIMLRGLKNEEKEKYIYIQTFGKFEIFSNGKRIEFANRKAKELLALLTDKRGGMVTMEFAINCIWEGKPLDDKSKALYRKAVSELRKGLNNAGCGDIVTYQRGQLALRTSMVKCDYYEVLDTGKGSGLYGGNYLEDYSWAEERNGLLARYINTKHI